MNPIKFSDTNLFFYIWMRNDKTGEFKSYDDVKHLIKIHSYTLTFDYIYKNFGKKENEKEARSCD